MAFTRCPDPAWTTQRWLAGVRTLAGASCAPKHEFNQGTPTTAIVRSTSPWKIAIANWNPLVMCPPPREVQKNAGRGRRTGDEKVSSHWPSFASSLVRTARMMEVEKEGGARATTRARASADA